MDGNIVVVTKKNVAPGKVKRTFDLRENVISEFDSFCKKNGIKSNYMAEKLMTDYLQKWGINIDG